MNKEVRYDDVKQKNGQVTMTSCESRPKKI